MNNVAVVTEVSIISMGLVVWYLELRPLSGEKSHAAWPCFPPFTIGGHVLLESWRSSAGREFFFQRVLSRSLSS